MALTYKQRLFVAYYLGESKGNATDAARKAGYRLPHEQGRQLLRVSTIHAAIEAKLDRVAMGQDEILARLSDLASASLGDFLEVDKRGYKVDLNRGRKKLHTLKKVKTRTHSYQRRGDDEPTIEVETEIEVKDSYQALVKLGEYHGLFKNVASSEPLGDQVPKDDEGGVIEP